MQPAKQPKWSRGTARARAKSLIADVEKRERESLRQRLRLVRIARQRAVGRIRSWSRNRMAHLRARAKAARQKCLERLRAASRRHAELVRQRRDLMLQKADRRFAAVRARRRRELDEAIRLQRLIRDRERKALKPTTTARERAQESDDQVRRNLDADMIPIFDRVAPNIHGSAKMSRTEAFLHWLGENPDEVVRMRAEMAEQDVDRWLQEQHEQERRDKRRWGEPVIIQATWRGTYFAVHEIENPDRTASYVLLMRPAKRHRRLLRWSLSVKGDDWSLGTPEATASGPSRPSKAETALARTWVDSLDGYKPLDDLSDVPF
jgi:hypothetical protein